LPWSGRVSLTNDDTLPLLTILHADATRYVTRSVANHLNDIAKKEPVVVVDTLRAWQKLRKQETRELAWMTNHALRTLIKQGHHGALALLQYDSVCLYGRPICHREHNSAGRGVGIIGGHYHGDRRDEPID